MPSRYLRPLLIVVFLIAIQVVFTCWSQVGGQYHLDLMHPAWKLGLSGAAALLITLIVADLIGADGRFRKRSWVYSILLIAVLSMAGFVTYYYHLNEPTDDDEDDSGQPTITRTAVTSIR
jgi:hypothetical protein